MITRVQFNNFGAYKQKTNNVSKPLSTQKVSNNVSFKRSGAELYEETVSLIDDARRKAERMGVKKLSAKNSDGASVFFESTPKGMILRIEHDNNREFQETYGIGCRITTSNGWVKETNLYPYFMLRETDEGEFDAIIQKYLPAVL